MIDKVIKGLECCTFILGKRKCSECPYQKGLPDNGCYQLQDDFHALLKEQEARVLDWDELEDWGNAVWFEDKDEHECYIALIANVGTYDAKFANVEPGNIHSLDFMRDFYMKDWRCWSARPTAKQRQAVKWNDRQ